MKSSFSWGQAVAVGSLSIGIAACTRKFVEVFRMEEYFIPVTILMIAAAIVYIFFGEKHIRVTTTDEKGEQKTIRISYREF